MDSKEFEDIIHSLPTDMTSPTVVGTAKDRTLAFNLVHSVKLLIFFTKNDFNFLICKGKKEFKGLFHDTISLEDTQTKILRKTLETIIYNKSK